MTLAAVHIVGHRIGLGAMAGEAQSGVAWRGGSSAAAGYPHGHAVPRLHFFGHIRFLDALPGRPSDASF